MKKITLLLQGAAALLLLGLCSCQKFENNPSSRYEIATITNTTGTGGNATFTYDGYGNPTDVKFADVSEMTPHYEFLYDKRHRMTDCIGALNNGLYTFWHRYHYNAKGLIDQDSLYRDGSLSEFPQPIGHDNQSIFYTYDGYERIIETKTYYLGRVIDTTWSYDASGNRVRPGFVYDHKSNIRQTNKIWMFLDQDYSVNNPLPAVSYNKAGLPLQFDQQQTEFPGAAYFFLRTTLNQCTITYNKR